MDGKWTPFSVGKGNIAGACGLALEAVAIGRTETATQYIIETYTRIDDEVSLVFDC